MIYGESLTGIDKITTRPELLVTSIRVSVGGQKLVAGQHKVCSLPVGEDVVALNPIRRLGGNLLVVWVC
jgi:hypothetical protein